mmetsp:Transcript_26134/g.58090  ORF Transcript_26134/g.58090 Transcript_26134/m.58090 type:complete len:248 (+) Transcript_26134:1679-2422(+)
MDDGQRLEEGCNRVLRKVGTVGIVPILRETISLQPRELPRRERSSWFPARSRPSACCNSWVGSSVSWRSNRTSSCTRTQPLDSIPLVTPPHVAMTGHAVTVPYLAFVGGHVTNVAIAIGTVLLPVSGGKRMSDAILPAVREVDESIGSLGTDYLKLFIAGCIVGRVRIIITITSIVWFIITIILEIAGARRRRLILNLSGRRCSSSQAPRRLLPLNYLDIGIIIVVVVVAAACPGHTARSGCSGGRF